MAASVLSRNAERSHAVGLRADGSVLATGSHHSVGLRADGRVVAVGDNSTANVG